MPDWNESASDEETSPKPFVHVSAGRIAQVGVLLFVFAIAGFAASGVEGLRARRAARWLASAEISLPEDWFKLARHGQNGTPPLDPESIAREVLAGFAPDRSPPPHLAEADSGSPASTSSATPQTRLSREMFRRSLRVAVDRSAEETLRIAICVSASSEDRAVRQANDLAAAYAARLRLDMAREVLRRTAKIGTIEDRAQEELRQIGPQLDVVIDRAVSKTAAYLPAAEKPVASPSRNGPATESPFVEESAEPPTEASPTISQRDKNQKTLEELRQRRDRLLVNRTAVHPEVRQLEAQIQAAERQLEAVPAPLQQAPLSPGKPPGGASGLPSPIRRSETPNAPAASPSQTESAAKSTELFQAIQALQRRIDAVTQELRQGRGARIPAAESLIRGDDLGVRWARQAEMATARVDWRALALVALTAGLVATAGVGMMWAGLLIDCPFQTTHGIERGLNLPVIGTIATGQSPRGAAESLAARARWKWPCLVGGSAVLGAYAVFLIEPFLAG